MLINSFAQQQNTKKNLVIKISILFRTLYEEICLDKDELKIYSMFYLLHTINKKVKNKQEDF